MAVASSVPAPCIATIGPVALTAEEGPNMAGDTKSNDVSSCSSAPSTKDATAAKPTPKSSFAAPKLWMVAFGVALAMCAGTVNAACSRSLGVFVSHVTGTVASVGMRIEGLTTGRNIHWDVFHSALLVSSFIFGSFLCGLVIPKNQVHFGGKSFYGVALLANSCLLVAAGFLAPPVLESATEARAVAAGCLAAMACGLQNAMCTMHFGAVIRTTHVTGTATDIGSTLGRAASILLRMGCNPRKGTPVEKVELKDDIAKFAVLLSIMMGFLCGAIFGTMLHQWIGMYGLLFPAGFTGVSGVLYTFFRTALKKQFKKWERRRVSEEMEEIEVTLQRAQTLLGSFGSRDRRAGKTKSDGEDLDDIDELLHHSLEVAHDLEDNLRELMGPRRPEGVARSSTL
mmetsp:Transcript_47157/g.136241  ORF Transcript_47157/g.136241 Transcript_47157/m.136241 type:complete len:398 (-) Transcript_47157:49-1242(-)